MWCTGWEALRVVGLSVLARPDLESVVRLPVPVVWTVARAEAQIRALGMGGVNLLAGRMSTRR